MVIIIHNDLPGGTLPLCLCSAHRKIIWLYPEEINRSPPLLEVGLSRRDLQDCGFVIYSLNSSPSLFYSGTWHPDLNKVVLRLSSAILLSLNTVSLFAWTTRLGGSLDSLTTMKGKSALLCCCYCSVSSGVRLCDPRACSTPGFPVLHHLSGSAQTRGRWVMSVIAVNCGRGSSGHSCLWGKGTGTQIFPLLRSPAPLYPSYCLCRTEGTVHSLASFRTLHSERIVTPELSLQFSNLIHRFSELEYHFHSRSPWLTPVLRGSQGNGVRPWGPAIRQ